MVGVTTVALIERRPDISRSLFSRYWRDVHGVMAARIPGFDRYTQHHVTPIGDAAPFEGIAIVSYRDEANRAGLATSEVTQHIHRDEQNVFRRALLYNLSAGADRVIVGEAPAGYERFLVIAGDSGDLAEAIARLRATARYLAAYDLTTGDPTGWNDTETGEGERYEALLHAGWDSDAAADAAVAEGGGYRLDARYVMVDDGRPTPLGLRGLDAVRTIEEAGAANQLEPAVVRAVYGAAFAP